MMSDNNPKTKVRAVFKCPDSFKDRFHESKCLLTISVGQEVHEDDKFLATLELVNNAFAFCTICVDDTLQRHSMGLYNNTNAESCYDISLVEGDNWLERNKHLYEQLTLPYEIVRWNKWLHHPSYSDIHAEISESYISDPEYRAAFDDSIEDFLTRFQRRLKPSHLFDYQKGFDTCRDYLFEECVAMCLWQNEGYHFEVYPSQRNAAMTKTHERYIKPSAPHLLNAVAIKFKNRKQHKPQHFAQIADAIEEAL